MKKQLIIASFAGLFLGPFLGYLMFRSGSIHVPFDTKFIVISMIGGAIVAPAAWAYARLV